MGTVEWPLVLFTVLGETSIGIILALWWLDRTPLDAGLYRKATLTSGALLGLALVASLLHLGHPEAAYRALTHLSSSWLSREILLFVLAALAWVYLFLQISRPNGQRRVAAGIAGLLGLFGIVSSAMIYVLPRVPAWNSAQTPLFFLLTTGLLGALSLLFLGRKSLSPAQMTGLMYWSLGCVLASLLTYILYFSQLTGMSPEGLATAHILTTRPLFWLRVLTNWGAPLILLLPLFKRKHSFNPNLLLTLLIVSGIGEFLGRTLFYLSAVGIHISALM